MGFMGLRKGEGDVLVSYDYESGNEARRQGEPTAEPLDDPQG